MGPAVAVSRSAACALGGALLSGPVAIAIVAIVSPQPQWIDAVTFAAHFHPIQTIPYFAGLLLVGGFVALITAIHGLAAGDVRQRTRLAIALASAFAAMVFANYAIQTTFVPALLRAAEPDALALAARLTMANPSSLGWTLEMWGYGILGVATWLVAPVFSGRRFGRFVAALFTLNGLIGLLGILATAMRPGWIVTPVGLWAFGTWNVVVVAMLIAVIGAMRDTGSAA